MATYFIIGGDTKEYGPISEDDLRQWIAEGRLNGQSLAKSEGDISWRTLASFPEFTDILPAGSVPTSASRTAASISGNVDFRDRDYEVDIGGCVSRGWNLYKENFGTLFGSFIIVFVLTIIGSSMLGGMLTLIIPKDAEKMEAIHLLHNFLFSGLLAMLTGPLTAGLYYVFLQTSRKLPVTVGDVFCGFQKCFVPSFLGALIVAWIGALCMMPFNIVNDPKLRPILEKLQNLQSQASPEDLQNLISQVFATTAGSLPVALVCLIPMIYFAVSFQFTLPLIVDKQMGAGTALATGWKRVHKHWWQLCGLTIVVGLVGVSGIVGCVVGIVFTLPISTAAVMAAYEIIFGRGRQN